jgi:hypothetical protein
MYGIVQSVLVLLCLCVVQYGIMSTEWCMYVCMCEVAAPGYRTVAGNEEVGFIIKRWPYVRE